MSAIQNQNQVRKTGCVLTYLLSYESRLWYNHKEPQSWATLITGLWKKGKTNIAWSQEQISKSKGVPQMPLADTKGAHQ